MHFAIPFLVLTAILNIVLGVFVFLGNPRLATSRSFLVLTLSVAAWCVGIILFYGFDSAEVHATAVKSYYISAFTMNTALIAFAGSFLHIKNKFLHLYLPILSWIILTGFVLFDADFLFTLGEKLRYGSEVILQPTGYAIYTTVILGFYIVTLELFFFNRNRYDLQKRKQINSILIGLVAAGLFATYFNLYLPWIQVYGYTWSGPLFTLFFVFLISYAILKHKLFSLRAVVARAFAYIFATGLLLVLYVVVANLVQTLLSPDNMASGGQFIANALLTIPLIILYPYAKKYFDKITNTVFYRDAYDPQTFFDDLNNILVANIDTDQLLSKSCSLIESNLKSEFVGFFILNTSYFENRLIGDGEQRITDQEAQELHRLLPALHKKVIYTDLDPESSDERRVQSILKANDVGVLVRIVSNIDFEVDGIGYLLLGHKRSGDPYSYQDLKVLEIAANELELAVENALRFEEIQQFNVTLQNKIDDATTELKTSNEKLKALDEAKDEFISMASHQLRTPLTSIKGYISMVVEGDAGEINEEQKKMLGQALFSSQRMVYLIADLLNVSRLRTGKFVIEKARTYLPDVVESEIAQLREGAAVKNIKLVFDKPKQFPSIELDETKIRQVIMNFIDNALYYTPNGGKITVELKDKKQSVEFSVKDTGIGVPKDQQHKLFTKFYRAENARRARPDGTGLGLFMAKKVVIAQNGSILFNSKEGKGSTFGFSFPKAASAASPALERGSDDRDAH